MPGVISVKGIRRLVDGLTDHTLESVRKLSRTEGSGSFEVGGSIVLDGKFFEDVSGEISFDGEIGGPIPVDGLPVDVDLGGGLERGWKYGGKGPMKLTYYVRYTTG